MESTSGAPVCYSVKRHAQLEQLVASERLHPVGGRKGAMAAAIFQLAAEDTTDAEKRAAAHRSAAARVVVGRGPAPRFGAGRRAELRRCQRRARCGASAAACSPAAATRGEPSWPAARRSPSQLKAAAAAYEQAAKYEAEVEGKSGTCAELSTVYRRLSLATHPSWTSR